MTNDKNLDYNILIHILHQQNHIKLKEKYMILYEKGVKHI